MTELKKIFMVGIGGAGVSALARLYHAQGHEVHGSDLVISPTTTALEQLGITIAIGTDPELVVHSITADYSKVVYSVAGDYDPYLVRARAVGIAEQTYPQALAELMKDFSKTIGVAGTNGKTTTTAMLAQIFLTANQDPTVVVGSDVPVLAGNARLGKSDYLIFESDEYRRAFHNYQPWATIITYIAPDHLDVYLDLNEIIESFAEYVRRVPADGLVVLNVEDAVSQELRPQIQSRVVTFGLIALADVGAQNIRYQNGKQLFDLVYHGNVLGTCELQLPGEHNVANALAAAAMALEVGVEFKFIVQALQEFQSARRRFEIVGTNGDTTIISDYAHTPDAVAKTIMAAHELFPDKKILSVFQPHQLARTKKLFPEFVAALETAGDVILSDVFFVSGRERPEDFNVSSAQLIDAAKDKNSQLVYGGSLEQTELVIRNQLKNYDIILIMGAGDIDSIARKLCQPN